MKHTSLVLAALVIFSHYGKASRPVRNGNISDYLTEKSLNGPQESQKTIINQVDEKKRRHGYWEFYWDDANTKILCAGTFKHGKQIDKWTYYSQGGTIEKEEINTFFGKRIKTTMYHPNGKIWKTGLAKVKTDKDYVNYYWVGKWKVYTSDGNFEKNEVYRKGKLKGSVEETEVIE